MLAKVGAFQTRDQQRHEMRQPQKFSVKINSLGRQGEYATLPLGRFY